MATREEFGQYLLLKKLTEDPLGETFRSGRLGQQGLDQVVLLRVLNGQGLDSEKLWASLSSRQEVQKALKSPNIGSGVDAGTERGVPYVAYDYISGKDLATLVAQASRESSPFPTDHALLIADRIGLALSAAYEARHAGERVLHGMVIPHLVMVSNEGETRLLGFEAGPALAEQASVLPGEIKRYLAPESRAGAKPAKTGDVFSLGAILFELLTGTPLPENPPDGYGPVIDQAQLAAERTALPADLAELLKRSLAPAGERIGDATAWHKALAKVMSAGGYNATTFNLAFFMHNLFREEIERESREIEAEKTMEIPTRGATVGGSGAETRALSQEEVQRAAEPAEDTGAVRERYGMEAPSEGGSKKGLWIGIAAVLVLLIGAGIAYYLTGGFTGESTQAETPATTPPSAVTEPEPAQPEGPTPEEIQAQIDQMLEEKTQALQKNIKEEYDQRIADMQKQLKDAEKANQEREQRLAEARAQAEKEEQARKAREAREAEEQAASEPASPDGQKPANATAQGDQVAAGGSAEQEKAAESAQQVAQRQQPTKTQEPAAAQPPPTPKEPAVKRGELVKPGPGVIQPRVTRRARPVYPTVAARLNREASVDVQVLVDENGKVIDAMINGEKHKFGFDEAALDAARKSSFAPANKDGVPVKMWTTIRFEFKR